MASPYPPWIKDVIKHVVRCIAPEHPVQTLTFLHEDQECWHLDVFPSAFEEDGNTVWEVFEVEMGELLGPFKKPRLRRVQPMRAIVNSEGIDLGVYYKGHSMHIVIHFEPPSEAPMGIAVMSGGKTTQKGLPN